MWKLFKRKAKKKQEETQPIHCEHNWKWLGNLYMEDRTEYFNQSDTVIAYQLLGCTHCQQFKEQFIMEESFPVYMRREAQRKREFIQMLEKEGFQERRRFMLRLLNGAELNQAQKNIEETLSQSS